MTETNEKLLSLTTDETAGVEGLLELGKNSYEEVLLRSNLRLSFCQNFADVLDEFFVFQ